MIIDKHGFDPRESDLSRTQSWDDFITELNYCVMKQYLALESGGHMGILVGDIKKKGKLYSMILEMIKPGTIKQVIIKAQHNCFSDSVNYNNNSFIPIRHEYMLLLQKDNPVVYDIMLTNTAKKDIRDMHAATWRDVVFAIMRAKGRPVPLDELYAELEGHEKTRNNKDWQAKIRQVLNTNRGEYEHVERGVWKVAS